MHFHIQYTLCNVPHQNNNPLRSTSDERPFFLTAPSLDWWLSHCLNVWWKFTLNSSLWLFGKDYGVDKEPLPDTARPYHKACSKADLFCFWYELSAIPFILLWTVWMGTVYSQYTEYTFCWEIFWQEVVWDPLRLVTDCKSQVLGPYHSARYSQVTSINSIPFSEHFFFWNLLQPILSFLN